ncbi:MAG: ribokinase [Cyanobacteria bacterium SID2]|nr:ribokinase [Cyanobacteria bacterium SID2]MBP0006551.1 ribokinase [Cyanobacteria bacterium SBC]
MSVVVFGSLNLDLVAQTPRLPVVGETVLGSHFLTASGGKGANQAVAAARLGASTAMVGCVGNDRFGEQLLAGLRESGVETQGVRVDENTHSGVAVVSVDQQGENTIVIVPGANGQVGEVDIEQLKVLLPDATTLLLQLEIPLPAVEAAARVARDAGVTVVLDPAPVPEDFPEDLYSLVDILTPNEIEASQLLGVPVHDRETALAAASAFRRRGAKTAVVTLGARGLAYATATESAFVPAFAVEAIDTTAAGDAFNGALAAALDRGLPWTDALRWGAAAGALSTTQAGAQPSLLDLETLEEALAAKPVSS